MQITSTALEQGLEIKLKGRMDAGWSDHVAKALEECLQSGQHTIFLNMEEIDYISSAGIRILVMYAKKLKMIQGAFCVVNPSAPVLRVLELSGLESLLAHPGSQTAGAGSPHAPGTLTLSEPGATAELFELDPRASLRVFWPGNPEPWLAGVPVSDSCVTVEFPPGSMGIGLGGFGNGEPVGSACLGEFLAAGGASVCLPSDGTNKADYMLQEGSLTPTLTVGYGAIGLGGFRRLLRFDKGPQQRSLPLTSVLKACLRANADEPVGLVIIAETASLIGACVQSIRAPSGSATEPQDAFAFPAVRDWLSFTAEPAFPNCTALVVGFAAAQTRQNGLRLLRPMDAQGEILGHFHAAAFPYQPLRKGKVDLQETIHLLFDSGQILGVLHLLNDWRELNGAGESQFLRGACWCSPLTW